MTWSAALLALVLGAGSTSSRPFTITVVDEATGRGVPLVELRTTDQACYYTDSNGVVAFHEPGLVGQTVYFHVKSHGYEFRKDGFGFRGKALQITEGGSARLPIQRLNIAERLYRVTGGGIYRDSVLAGLPVPLREPVLNGQVFGSDSVVNTHYRGKLYWFWGDTNRPSYPLGNYHVPGATSELPTQGGLDPKLGVNLRYFLDAKGFARPLCRMPGEGPTWIHGLVVLDDAGRERLYAAYLKVRGTLEVYEHGLAVFDDEQEQFTQVTVFPRNAPFYPGGHPFRHTVDGVEYVYFATPYPLTRVRAEPRALADLSAYEAFTCLREGSRLDKPELDRDAAGRLRYGWKKNTPPLGPQQQAKLVRSGTLRADEALLHLNDPETGKSVVAHGGSVYWNPYRQRWVMLTVEAGGTSYLGEVWYAEADTPVGPWVYARKVVTHERYSFYNPKQHPFFDQEGGRVLYFEGTYTHTFSGNPDATPRYDYNQVMYRLDLADPRLAIPVAFYPLGDPGLPERVGTVAALKPGRPLQSAFFALDRPVPGTIPVYAIEGGRLRMGTPTEGTPLFHALPAQPKDPPATSVPLYEFVAADGSRRAYTTDPTWSQPGFERRAEPLCRVWRSPLRVPLPRE